MLLRGKVAIVTGATGGIGKAVIHKLCREGARVIGIYRSQSAAAEKLQAELAEGGFEAAFYKGSVCDEEFVSNTVKSSIEKYKSIDILINNAGITRDAFLPQMQSEDWKNVFETNFLGSYICAREVLPHMLERESGRVVNIISISGVIGKEAQTNYCASKGAVIGLTRLLSRQYSDKGIYFNSIAPGLIETDIIDTLTDNKKTEIINSTNMKRIGKAEDVAGAVLFLCSSLSDYCNNTILSVDGGLLR